MPDARRERIAVAVQAALTTGCGAPVERDRRTPVEADEAPKVVLYDLGQQAALINFGLVNYTMQIAIEGTVTGSSDDALGPAVNALYVEMLRSFADPTLGGLCVNLIETSLDKRVAPETESSKPLATFTLSMDVEFETPDGDPTG